MATSDESSFEPAALASNLFRAADCELSAAAALLKNDQSERSTTRALSEACRGIELVMKGLVAQVHWSQVFEEPAKASLSALAEGTFKSASIDECIKRLENLTALRLKERDPSRLASVRKLRNAFEHLGRTPNVDAARGALGAALHVLVELLVEAEEHGLLPDDAEGMRTQLAQELSEFDRFAKARMNDLRPALAGSECFGCPKCTQPAAVIDEGLRCHFCGDRTPPERAADYFIETEIGRSKYDLATGGDTWPVFTCSDCDADAVVQRQDPGTPKLTFLCFCCGESWLHDRLQPCARCGRLVDADDIALCSDCLSYQMERDD